MLASVIVKPLNGNPHQKEIGALPPGLAAQISKLICEASPAAATISFAADTAQTEIEQLRSHLETVGSLPPANVITAGNSEQELRIALLQ